MPGLIGRNAFSPTQSTNIQWEMILTNSVAQPLPPFPVIPPTMVRDTYTEDIVPSSVASVEKLLSINLAFVCCWVTRRCGLCLARVELPSGEGPLTHQLTLAQGSN